MNENIHTRQIRHLYDLSHATPGNPALNSMHSAKFQNHIHKKDILLPQVLEAGKFCEYCGVIFIPVINLNMRVVFGKSDKKKKLKNWTPRSRKLRYSCLICQKYTDYDLPTSTKGSKTNISIANEDKDPFVATWEPPKKKLEKQKEKEVSSAKERAKKRKKNNLSSLLSAKKEQEAKEKKIGSVLSLEEFMKN